ncbi:Mdm33 family-domain-containing protein [Dunaliella salina]|uniref:Mdm33 family-domain-containing protein n=1 Tax=Dunaliella salina TaxID=3046 RepID=A0ABQ7GD97_DUNSA|nr:Mdm33 family-domain-containing protein [Dunaliella salina]|eukprot:KAF5832584.1 Mdm33 family-domain-containing protein [Dunaliella salina]
MRTQQLDGQGQHFDLHPQRPRSCLTDGRRGWGWDASICCSTELCRMEHKTDADVAAARDAYEKAADEVDAAQVHLFKAIRERYTEEQLWGDKIRRTATWWTWGLMGLQMLSFMGVILVIEPRRVRLMQGHMQESLQQHEAVMREHLDSQLSTHFAQVRQAVQDSREVNVVLHSLEEMQQMGMLGAGAGTIGSVTDGQVQHVHLAQGGAGGHHSRVGDEKGEELAKVLSAVVTFMDGVNTELSVMRGQLGRLEAARKQPSEPIPGAPVFASGAEMQPFPYGEGASHLTSGAQREGEEDLYSRAAVQEGFLDRSRLLQQQQQQQRRQHLQQSIEEEEDERHGALGRPSHEGVSRGKRSWWSIGPPQQWSPEQAAGVAAGVGSGVGAVVGALLVAYFSSR